MDKTSYASIGILSIGIIVTILTWWIVFGLIEENYLNSFKDDSQSMINKIESRLELYSVSLLGTVGLFAASEEVTNEEWGIFISSTKLIDSFPGIQGVGFNKYLASESEKTDLLNTMRGYGITDFEIKPPGERSEYFPVVYLFPENEANKRAIGFDIYSEPNRADAVNNLKLTKEMAITGKIILVQDSEEDTQNGFLMLVPVFDHNNEKLIGLISAVFRMNDLVEAIIEKEFFEENNIKIYDSKELPDSLFFDSNELSGLSIFDENYVFRDSINFGGKDWKFIIQSSHYPLNNSDRNILILIPAVGFGISIMGYFAFINFNKSVIAKQVQKRRNEFESMISHDLKTPLVPIIGYCDMLLTPNLLGKLNDDQLNAVNKILNNTDHIKKLIQNILDIQKIDLEQLKLEYSIVNLREFISEIIVSHKAIMTEKNINFSMSNIPSINVKMDREKIKEVMTNIIQNAVDFVPAEKGIIRIEGKELGEKFRITISNNGQQIPHEELKLIFKKFHQVESGEKRMHGGSGLGLAICKGIIESHGGKMWAESNSKKTSIMFEIPSNINNNQEEA